MYSFFALFFLFLAPFFLFRFRLNCKKNNNGKSQQQNLQHCFHKLQHSKNDIATDKNFARKWSILYLQYICTMYTICTMFTVYMSQGFFSNMNLVHQTHNLLIILLIIFTYLILDGFMICIVNRQQTIFPQSFSSWPDWYVYMSVYKYQTAS